MEKIDDKILILGMVIVICITFLLIFSNEINAESEPPNEGDWIIDNETIIKDKKFIINGNLTIEKKGKLILDNVSITINTSFEGEIGIFVKQEGNLFAMNHTNLTFNNPKYDIKFEVNGTMKFDNCSIYYLWRYFPYYTTNRRYGVIEINSNNISISNCTIKNFMFFCKSSNIIFDNNTIDIQENFYFSEYGIRCDSSEINIKNNNFKNFKYGIYSYNSKGFIFNNNFSPSQISTTYSSYKSIVYCRYGDITIKNNKFFENENLDFISINCLQTNVSIKDNEINNKLIITNCDFANVVNNSFLWGSINCIDSNVTVTNNKMKELDIENCNIFVSNNTIEPFLNLYGITGYGGKIFIYNNTIMGTKNNDSYGGYGIGIFNIEKFKSELKIKKNYLTKLSAAILCSNATISENIIINNQNGIYCSGRINKIFNNIIEKNNIGLSSFNSTLYIWENQFRNNTIAIDLYDGKLDPVDVNKNNLFENNVDRIIQNRIIVISVNYLNDTPVVDASILIKDNVGEEVWNGTTNKYGMSSRINSPFNTSITLTEYKISENGNEILYSPFNITIKTDNQINWTKRYIDENSTIIKIIIEPLEEEIVKKEEKSNFYFKLIIIIIVILGIFSILFLYYLFQKKKKKENLDHKKNILHNIQTKESKIEDKPDNDYKISKDDINKAIHIVHNGLILHREKKFEEAVKSYHKAISLHPHYETFYKKAESLEKLGKYDEGLVCCEKALSKKLNYEKALFLKGIFLNHLNRFDEALIVFRKVLEINPKLELAWYNKGVALDELRKYEEAIICINKALELRSFPEAWYNLGVSNYKIKKYDKAIEYFNKALNIRINYESAFYNKGKALIELKRYEEALDCFEKTIKINTENEKALKERQNCLKELKQNE